ncbi:glycoside hydrolase family 2 protein [Arcticibacter tournemirensis]|uniref:Glycosyl hydrolase n=1 Tax=Arcticibacter tournemirensis TaxID=699437 RepID=A0A4Q0M989_9SPHI|nr:glycoside hydrolase family 2 TIM barrel-domain containing protein [Arcticibacter tournemirensis]RXF69704.1 glycosyl hydrolase [Arcticibacter tournemirensis]
MFSKLGFLKCIVPVMTGFIVAFTAVKAQDRYELNSGWKMAAVKEVKELGTAVSLKTYSLANWKPAVVPGTVLTSMLENKAVPDPFWGMNNEKIPDIYHTGRDYYTYWFSKDFKESYPSGGKQVWLTFRGINYSCEIFLNGKKVNPKPYKGMFLRKSFNISKLLSRDGNNRLAVIVYPPDPVGNPNGGQGGDGVIARNVSHQYVAGWDWIRPIRDRNTGIWDKVYIEKTGSINLKNPHVVTLVPGKRNTDGLQKPATVKVSAELENATDRRIEGILQYILEGTKVSKNVSVAPGRSVTVELPDHILKNPRLWWPAGYGKQDLYNTNLQFLESGKLVSDSEKLSFGVREVQTEWNADTKSKQILVNGQKIFIKGGNWIISDAMLRFTKERYDAEIRYHRDMNLNLIRIWGGALIERPEFYEACDKYGMLVLQDFWMSGDCNGRWVDPMKKEDQWTRRQYPDDHHLFLESAADMIKMVRNHPSLAMWCGGNEITPPEDILVPLRDSILPKLDGTRWFIDYSNSDEMSYNIIGGNGDGPYTIQPVSSFWEKRTFPFNSEVGSVGVGDYESLERFIPKENMKVPVPRPGQQPSEEADSVWTYHTYTGVGYEQSIEPYGKPSDVHDFATKAQLVNYDQYRGLMEGFSSHMWDWYTGVIIWKTQNPWTAMRGQMYDYYLDPNACLYGLRAGSRSLNIMCNPVDGMVMLVNNGFKQQRNLMLAIKTYDMSGKEKMITQVFAYIEPSSVKKILSVKKELDELSKEEGAFLSLQILDEKQQVLCDNFYWYPNQKGEYSGLNKMKQAALVADTRSIGKGKVEVKLKNPVGNPVAFFNRISLLDPATGKRILPAFYDDNYVSVMPGAEKTVIIEYPSPVANPVLSVKGWNVNEQKATIK